MLLLRGYAISLPLAISLPPAATLSMLPALFFALRRRSQRGIPMIIFTPSSRNFEQRGLPDATTYCTPVHDAHATPYAYADAYQATPALPPAPAFLSFLRRAPTPGAADVQRPFSHDCFLRRHALLLPLLLMSGWKRSFFVERRRPCCHFSLS